MTSPMCLLITLNGSILAPLTATPSHWVELKGFNSKSRLACRLAKANKLRFVYLDTGATLLQLVVLPKALSSRAERLLAAVDLLCEKLKTVFQNLDCSCSSLLQLLLTNLWPAKVDSTFCWWQVAACHLDRGAATEGNRTICNIYDFCIGKAPPPTPRLSVAFQEVLSMKIYYVPKVK